MSEAATLDVIKHWDYQNDRALIVPYVPQFLSDKFPENFLTGLYLQTKQDGLLRRTFPGTSNCTLNWFIHYFYSRSMLIGMIKPGEVAGYAWMYDSEGDEKLRKGSVGVCFFKKYWGDKVLRDLACLGLEWFFKEAGFYTIYGTVADWNRVSMRFGRLIGFQPCGCLPRFFLNHGTLADNHLFVLKREDFLGWAKF